MTNKNVSQLPINSDPQDSDWLLGASGNSPSVFQKIPVGSLIPTTQNSGSIKFSLPVNQNTALTNSGYYFTDNIAANIGIDCSGLGIGEHINWQNLSTKSIIFYGLSSIDGVTIPANKGIKVETGNSIDFFLLDANHNIKKIAGVYSLDWVPGYTPPYLTFTYASNGDSNDFGYYLGATKYNSSYQNIYNRGEVAVSASSYIDIRYPWGIYSRTNDGSGATTGVWHSGGNDTPWNKTQFLNNKTARINRISLWASNYHDTQPFYFQASNNNTDWTNLISTPAINPNSWWTSSIFSNDTFYTYYRFLGIGSPTYYIIGDVRYYGDLIDG